MIVLSKISEDTSTITLGWTPVAAAIGYRFTAEKQAKPSHTWNAQASSVCFAKGSAWYRVEALGVDDQGEYPQVTPALKYPRPVLTDPVICRPTASNHQFFLQGRDFVVEMPKTPITWRGPAVLISDGGKGYCVGGEIIQNTDYGAVDSQYGFYLLGVDYFHAERIKITGSQLGQAFMLSPIWQIPGSACDTFVEQFCRLETRHPVGAIHTDCIQSAAGPRQYKVYRSTHVSTGLCIQMQPREHGYSGPIDQWEYEELDVHQQPLGAAAPVLNKSWGGSAGSKPFWPEYHKSFYLDVPAAPDNEVHVNWSPNLPGWNPGGGAGAITGEDIKLGQPPGGDFCKPDECGITYIKW